MGMETLVASQIVTQDYLRLSLKEATILSLGIIHLPYTFNETWEMFELFNDHLSVTTLYHSISQDLFAKYLRKLVSQGILLTKIEQLENGKRLFTYELSDEGKSEFSKLYQDYTGSGVHEAIIAVKEEFGLY